VQKNAAKVGFDWPDDDGAMEKLGEELGELREAVQTGEVTFEELGDVLFSAVNTARHLGIDPEEALTASTEKFIRRFSGLENAAAQRGLKLEDMSLEEMDRLYEEQKRG
jgi:tetrapyrrole methylase family protein/MazG family protein